jgi:hypothetical protein
MSQRVLNHIRDAVLAGRYALSEHAYDEMDEDNLDILDVESAVLRGRIEQTLTQDPRGTRYVVVGTACDELTPVAVVVRFVERDQLLVITVYEIK